MVYIATDNGRVVEAETIMDIHISVKVIKYKTTSQIHHVGTKKEESLAIIREIFNQIANE